MGELIVFNQYQDFKNVLDAEVKEAAAGFVRIGYLLKYARDNQIVQQAGYADVNEFAKANYGLTRDMVSRYIAINDKYSMNGNSMELLEKYQQFGYSKLAEMLTLPDEIADVIEPSTTREEIREIKKELKEEQSVSDLEVMLEPQQETEITFDNNLEKAMYELLKEHPELYKELYYITDDMLPEEKKSETIRYMCPNGAAVHIARVPQIGRLMISVKDSAETIELINMRSNEKESYSWSDMIEAIEKLSPYESDSADDAYCKVYGKHLEEIAPAQQPEKVENTKCEEVMPKQIEESAPAAVEEAVIESVTKEPENVTESTEIVTESTEIVTESTEIVNESTEIVNEEKKNKEIVSEEIAENSINIGSEVLSDNDVAAGNQVIEKMSEELGDEVSRLTYMVRDKKWMAAKLKLVDISNLLESIITRSCEEEEDA